MDTLNSNKFYVKTKIVFALAYFQHEMIDFLNSICVKLF